MGSFLARPVDCQFEESTRIPEMDSRLPHGVSNASNGPSQ
jgi:hypothetical protein